MKIGRLSHMAFGPFGAGQEPFVTHMALTALNACPRAHEFESDRTPLLSYLHLILKRSPRPPEVTFTFRSGQGKPWTRRRTSYRPARL